MTQPAYNKRAQCIEDIPRTCGTGALELGDLNDYFVDTKAGRNPHASMRRRIRNHLKSESPKRLLVYGHGGCGKSTELVQLQKELDGEFCIVTLSIKEEMNIASIRPEDIILVIIERLFDKAKSLSLDISEAQLKPVFKYFSDVVQKHTSDKETALELSAGVDTSANPFSGLIGLFAKLRGEIRFGTHSEQSVVSVLRKRPGDLIQQANTIIQAFSDSLPEKQQLLIIVEDLDKISIAQAREVFIENGQLLAAIKSHIIYTIPIFTLHSYNAGVLDRVFDDKIGLPMIKVCEPDLRRSDAGFDLVKEIILKRIEQRLIEEDALDLLIGKTGGVLQHVFKVLNTVANMDDEFTVINESHIRYGLSQVRIDLVRQIAVPDDFDEIESVDQLYAQLEKYAEAQKKGRIKPESSPINQVLLSSAALVEYNGECWLGVHPLIRDELQDRQRTSS